MSELVFDTFEEINHIPLRVFNRMVTFYNIMGDYGATEAQKYASNFNEMETLQIVSMMEYTKQHGREKAKQFALEGFTPTEDKEESHDGG